MGASDATMHFVAAGTTPAMRSISHPRAWAVALTDGVMTPEHGVLQSDRQRARRRLRRSFHGSFVVAARSRPRQGLGLEVRQRSPSARGRSGVVAEHQQGPSVDSMS